MECFFGKYKIGIFIIGDFGAFHLHGRCIHFYRIYSGFRYLESVMQDVKDGKAHFAEHDLIEVD